MAWFEKKPWLIISLKFGVVKERKRPDVYATPVSIK